MAPQSVNEDFVNMKKVTLLYRPSQIYSIYRNPDSKEMQHVVVTIPWGEMRGIIMRNGDFYVVASEEKTDSLSSEDPLNELVHDDLGFIVFDNNANEFQGWEIGANAHQERFLMVVSEVRDMFKIHLAESYNNDTYELIKPLLDEYIKKFEDKQKLPFKLSKT